MASWRNDVRVKWRGGEVRYRERRKKKSSNYRPPVLVHNEVGIDLRANPTEAEPTNVA